MIASSVKDWRNAVIEFNNRFITTIVNMLLLLYQLPQLITGLIGLAIFHNCKWYKNEEAGVKVIRVNKGNFIGRSCFSSGPIIFVTDNCDENTLRHETGHSKQSLICGPLFHIIISIPSIVLFWTRRIKNKDDKWYLSFWPEGSCRFGAEELGHTHR